MLVLAVTISVIWTFELNINKDNLRYLRGNWGKLIFKEHDFIAN